MRKSLFIMILISVIAINFTSAACSDLVACTNQDSKMYCLPNDSKCTYITFVEDNGKCIINEAVSDSDRDSDSWTDACDAFPINSSEWMDIDADGIGHNLDCDDYDPGNRNICVQSTPTPGIKTSGGNNKKYCLPEWDCTEWTDCTDGAKTRLCTKTNGCDGDYNKPNEWEGCPRYEILKSNVNENKGNTVPVEPDVVTINKTQPEIGDNTSMPNLITGQAFNFLGAGSPLALLIIALIIIAVAMLILMGRKKKDRA